MLLQDLADLVEDGARLGRATRSRGVVDEMSAVAHLRADVCATGLRVLGVRAQIRGGADAGVEGVQAERLGIVVRPAGAPHDRDDAGPRCLREDGAVVIGQVRRYPATGLRPGLTLSQVLAHP